MYIHMCVDNLLPPQHVYYLLIQSITYTKSVLKKKVTMRSPRQTLFFCFLFGKFITILYICMYISVSIQKVQVYIVNN